MEKKHRRTVYGIGCITLKQTNPPHGAEYVYAEWFVDGRHNCKSCGNAAYARSRQRAKELLREALEERIASLEEELANLRVVLGTSSGANAAPLSEPSAVRSRTLPTSL